MLRWIGFVVVLLLALLQPLLLFAGLLILLITSLTGLVEAISWVGLLHIRTGGPGGGTFIVLLATAAALLTAYLIVTMSLFMAQWLTEDEDYPGRPDGVWNRLKYMWGQCNPWLDLVAELLKPKQPGGMSQQETLEFLRECWRDEDNPESPHYRNRPPR